MEKIFVQIASYRDPELSYTVEDCMNQAKFPDRLSFGIVNQYNKLDSFCFDVDRYSADARFKIYNVENHNSLGACWARSETNKMYAEEDFILQIDSHSRFIKNWDTAIIDSWKSLNDPKAVYTSYPPPYDPLKPLEAWTKKPYIIEVYDIQKNLTKQRPKTMPDWQVRKSPYRARHLAAGFIFGRGSIIKDVPYDPDFYFSGEETSLAVRLFTHGYNLYHPSDFYIWHYYTRRECAKHWKDLKTSHLTSKSHSRLRSLLGFGEPCDFGVFGLGKERTVDDYQKYSGINFEKSTLSPDVINNIEPTLDYHKKYWCDDSKDFCIKIPLDCILFDGKDDVSFIAFFLEDKNKKVIKRIDLTIDQFKNKKNINEKSFHLDVKNDFSENEPVSFFTWSYSSSSGWLTKGPSNILKKNDFIFDRKTNVSPFLNFKNNKRILIVGSGRSGVDVVKYENYFDHIVVVNNAWALTDKWSFWVHPNDYKGSRPPSLGENQKEINANIYGKSLRKYGGIHECGFSIMLNASYWVLDNLNASEIYYLGADMNYSPDKDGKTHFYGVGIDIQNRGISDPDYMVKVRSGGDPNYLNKIYKRFESVANENNCNVYNLSTDASTRLPYLRAVLLKQ